MIRLLLSILTLFSLSALAACGDGRGASEEAPPAPQTIGANDETGEQAPPRQIEERLTGALSPGEWIEKDMAGDRSILFGPPATEATFSLRCDAPNGRIIAARSQTLKANESIDMTLLTPAGSATFDARATGSALPTIEFHIALENSILDHLAQTETRFAVSPETGPELFLPASPIIGAFIDDCRERA